MTRSHRRWHLAAWLILAPVILAMMIAAHSARSRAGGDGMHAAAARPAEPERRR